MPISSAISRLLWIPLAVAGALACESDHLVFTTYTKTGVDMSFGNNGMPAEAVFGYKRFEGALVPVELPSVEDAQAGDDTEAGPSGSSRAADGSFEPRPAYSVFAGLCLVNDWGAGFDLGQVFATGAAAQAIASQPDRAREIARLLECREEEDEAPPTAGGAGSSEGEGEEGEEGEDAAS